MNRIVLTGNLTADPELRTTSSGTPVCTFHLAVQRRFKNAQGEKEVDFIPIIVWRELANLCNQYLSKGRKCAVVGSIQTRSYQAQDGSTRHVTEVVADEVEFLTPREQQPGSGKAQGGNQGSMDNYRPEPTVFTPQPQARQTSMGYVPPMGQDDDEDGLPF